MHGWLTDTMRWAVDVLATTDPVTALAVLIGALLLCGLGMPIPEDIILVTTGILAALGKFPLWLGIVLCLVGVLCGDATLFFVGRRYGEPILLSPFAQRTIGPEGIAKARSMIKQHARFICFMARFLPGIRSAIYLVAGAVGVRPAVYLTQDGLAALLSVPFWVVVGWMFGHNVDAALASVQRWEGWILTGVGVAIAGYGFWRYTRRGAEEGGLVGG